MVGSTYLSEAEALLAESNRSVRTVCNGQQGKVYVAHIRALSASPSGRAFPFKQDKRRQLPFASIARRCRRRTTKCQYQARVVLFCGRVAFPGCEPPWSREKRDGRRPRDGFYTCDFNSVAPSQIRRRSRVLCTVPAQQQWEPLRFLSHKPNSKYTDRGTSRARIAVIRVGEPIPCTETASPRGAGIYGFECRVD